MPVLSPAYKVISYASPERGLALSFHGKELKVDALIQGKDVKWLDTEQDLSNYLVSLLLSAEAPLLVRPFLLPLKSEGEIDQALPHEVEGIFQTPQGEIAFDRVLLPQEGNKRKVTLLVTTKEGIEKTLHPYQEKGVEGEVVTAAPIALALAAHTLSPLELPRGVLYVDEEMGLFLIEKGGVLLGSTRLTLPLKKGGLSRAIGSLTRELGLPIAEQILSLSSPSDVSVPPPYQLIDPLEMFGLTVNELKTFALPLGGALNSLVGFTSGINFREKILQPPLPWKRARRSLAYVAASFLFAFITLFFAGEAYLSWKEDLLKEQWAYTLSLLGKSEETFEETYHEKTGAPLQSVGFLTTEEISDRAYFVQKELSSTPILFPLHPNLPRVSDLLAWLADLEEVNGEEERLQIVSINYSLLKRPEMEKKQEKYQAKVDIEFTTSSPKWAREFHDLLIEPNPFVDPKGEVKWNVSRGSYKTSFLLKDQTAYVH